MKKSILTASIIALALGLTTTVRSQVYQFSQILPEFGAGVFYQGNLVAGFGSANSAVSDTATINQGAGTIENAGTIYVPALTETGSFQQTQSLGAVFPNPPTMVTGDVQLTLSFSGGFIPFDTGMQSLIYQGGTIWGFNGTAALTIPLSLSYSLLSGGQTYTGSLETFLPATIDLGSKVDIANYPGSIQIMPDKGTTFVTDGDVDTGVNITAADGFVLNGLTVTPEPSSLALLGLGGLGVLLVLQRNKRMATNSPAKI